ncbi:hypothetical protein [Curtobacterium sp. RRHDQ10]|uniref:hypothetical protein n=1 Tax=Curtobacterium phyllosphaerae TaxID=3413379 RepID=UPI003BF199B1
MTEPLAAPAASSTSDALRMIDIATAVSSGVAPHGLGARVATMTDDMLLDELRRNARVATRQIRPDFAEVHTPTKVLGYVRRLRKTFIALRGDDPAWAEEIGSYPSESLAVEALRMRRA